MSVSTRDIISSTRIVYGAKPNALWVVVGGCGTQICFVHLTRVTNLDNMGYIFTSKITCPTNLAKPRVC